MKCPVGSEQAIEDFIKNNVDSGRFRKHLIDWVQFKKVYGVSLKYTQRQRQVLMNKASFWTHYETLKWKEQDIQDEWDKLVNDPGADSEGSGVTIAFWIDVAKERLLDRAVYSNREVTEASKQAKDMKEDEKNQLLDLAHKGAAQLSDIFLHSAKG